MKFLNLFTQAQDWFNQKPYRDLEQAYHCVLAIKSIETEHFGGKKVSNSYAKYGDSVIRYFNREIKRNLKIAEVRLNQFLTNRSSINSRVIQPEHNYDILAKIELIEQYLLRYVEHTQYLVKQDYLNSQEPVNLTKSSVKLESVSNKTSILPRSLWRTIRRVQQEIDPNSQQTEEEVLSKFRRSRYKTAISIKFFLILIIIPLLTHQVTKTFIITPLVNKYATDNQELIFINRDFEEEALLELQQYEQKIRFETLLGTKPKLSPEEIDKLLEEKVTEIAAEYKNLGTNAIENIFADIFSLLSFGLIIFFSQKEIAIVKSFLDDLTYGLSDSAKAFLIILLTDIFVGYHSPHGWEIILEGISRHFGLPENREFNFLFIATFPVILDTVLKYWIFRYLNRISPSSVATYRSMNE